MRSSIPALFARAAVAGVLLSDLSGPRLAAAAWPDFGRAIVAASGEQAFPKITGDGAGGAIIAWLDLRSPATNIFAQHVTADGKLDPRWPASGRALLSDPLGLSNLAVPLAFASIASDGEGGAIVAWQDERSTVTASDIYAQRVRASGVVDGRWPANGLPLSEIAGLQKFPTLLADGGGGAIVTWMDARPGAAGFDIYAQHVLGSGVVDPRWPVNGLAVSTAPGTQQLPELVEDGAGGAIIAWSELRDAASGLDIYAQRVLGTGSVDPAWPVNGRAISTALGDQFDVTIAADGAGGALMTWMDTRGDVSDIFAHHVQATGAVDPAWPADGLLVGDAALVEESPKIVADGAGGGIVVWEAFRARRNLIVQHVKAAGVVDAAWPVNGRALNVTDAESHTNGVIASDGAGGVIVAWDDRLDIFAQHVLASGNLDPAYPAGGRQVCILPSPQLRPAIVAAGPSGAIVAWSDLRNEPDGDLFALQVLEAGTTDVPPPGPAADGIRFASPVPNPARVSLTLRFSLPSAARVRLAVYDVRGRRLRELASGAHPPGDQAIEWDLLDEAGHPVRPGLYFARLEVDGRVLTHKIVRSG